MYPYLATVHYYDGIKEDFTDEYVAIYADSMTAAMKQIEDYYGDDMDECYIVILDGEQSLLTFDKETYNRIKQYHS